MPFFMYVPHDLGFMDIMDL